MGMPAKTLEVFNQLKLHSKRMRTMTYKELGEATGLAPVGLGQQLGWIRDQVCRERGLPWLNVIAVSSGDWRPGDSFLPDGVAIGRDQELLWRGMVLQVFAFDWEKVVLAA